jgi:hypothetical protein
LALIHESDGEINPYAPPRADVVPPEPMELVDLAECGRLRSSYLGAESAVRTVGAGCILAAAAIVCLFYIHTTDERTVWPVFVAFMIVIGGIAATLGLGLRSCRGWARWGAIVLLPLATILLSWVCWLELLPLAIAVLLVPPMAIGLAVLASPSAAAVCRRSYRIAIQRTPHLRRPHWPIWTGGLVELVLIIVAIVWWLIAG